MEKILITGGAGFIGKNISQQLISMGYSIRIIDNLDPQIHGDGKEVRSWIKNYDIDFIQSSILDVDLLKKSLIDVTSIIHLASKTGTGQSMYQISEYTNTNILGTSLLLNTILENKIPINKFALTSSRSIYGEGQYICTHCNLINNPKLRTFENLKSQKWNHYCLNCNNLLSPIATSELSPINPASIYASNKYTQEDLIRIFCESLGFGYGIFRLQNVYGEGQSLRNPYTGILSIFANQLRQNLNLNIYEDGQMSRDFVYIDDVTSSIISYLINSEFDKKIVTNVGTGVPIKVEDIAKILIKKINPNLNYEITGEFRVGDIRTNFASMDNYGMIFGKKEFIQFDKGIDYLLKWVNDQPIYVDKTRSALSELKARKLA